MASTLNPSARKSRRRSPASRRASIGSRIVPIAGAILLAVLLAWPVVTLNLSDDALLKSQNYDALSYDPASPRAAAAAAGSKLDAGHPHEAMRLGRQAVQNSLLSAAGLRTWGMAAQSAGDLSAASRLMGQAAALGWRDPATQLWLIVAAMQAKDFPATMTHMDALTRTVGMNPQIQNMLDSIGATPGVRAELIQLLATKPSWRTDYFVSSKGAEIPRLLVRANLLVSLKATAAPPTPQETLMVTNALVGQNAYLQAFNLWRVLHGAALNAIDDPGFERINSDPETASPFEWRIFPLVDGNAQLEASPKGGRWLHVTDTGGAAGTIIRQIVALTPGPHKIGVSARLNGASAADAFRIRLTCLAPGGLTFRSVPARGGGDTGTIALDVTVPGGDSCGVQSLELIAQTVDQGDVEGWFDNFFVS